MTGLRSLLAAAIVLGATVLFLTPAYQQNDDPVLGMIVSGTGIALKPDPHLMFTHIALGRGLAALHGEAPGVPWYGLYLLGAHLLAQAGVLLALTVTRPLRDALPVYLLYWAAVGIYFPLRLQFTSAATLCVQSGVLLALAALTTGSTGRAAWGRLGAAVSLIVLGAAIRLDALLLGVLCAAPVAALALARRRDAWPRALTVVFVVSVSVLALHQSDQAAYDSDPGWRAFRELNAVRKRVVDYESATYSVATAPLYRQLGWSENDAILLRQWFYPDPVVFSTVSISTLVAESPHPPLGVGRAWRQASEAFSRWPLVPMLLILPFLAGGRSGWSRVGLTLGFGVVVVVVLAVFLKAPDQVVMPAIAFAAAAGLVRPGEPGGDLRARGRWGRFTLALALLGVVLSLGLRYRDSGVARANSRELHESLALLGPRADRLYVAWAGHFPYERILPLESPATLARLRLYSLGWPQRSPVADRMLGAFGITDLFSALCGRDDVFLIAERGSPPPLEVYGRERYGREVRFEEQLRTPAFLVHRCTGLRD
jgi:hypothetical protein